MPKRISVINTQDLIFGASIRSSWDDVWEETPHIPRRQMAQATQAKKAAEKAKRSETQTDTDSWRDVENE